MSKRFNSPRRSRQYSFAKPSNGGNFRRGQGGFRNHSKQVRPLDINLFIKKAKEQQEEQYTPLNSFESLCQNEQLLRNIKNKKYTIPTPIQDKAIEHIKAGSDLIGIANTGTGKTAAFLIPMIEKVLNDRNQKVFIVAPTRELAIQIKEELKSFTTDLNINSALLIGGSGYGNQIFELKKNPQFVIGTPGRIKDLAEKRILDLSKFQNIVLDEVDLMVDIGFLKTVEYFISQLSKTRQSLFFSATIDGKVKRILEAFVREPITVSVKKQETAEFIDQNVVYVKDKSQKIEQLHDLLIQRDFDKVLVFGRTKWSVENLSKDLVRRGFKVGAIHGNKSQSQRRRVLEEFKQEKIQVLLATDVASRGLDIENVTHVINYDAPDSYEDYVHRIGRTGRANKKGIALTFI